MFDDVEDVKAPLKNTKWKRRTAHETLNFYETHSAANPRNDLENTAEITLFINGQWKKNGSTQKNAYVKGIVESRLRCPVSI